MTSAQACSTVVGNNAESGVTWIQSCVRQDQRKAFCVADAPPPESIRASAARTINRQVDNITPVSVLDPNFYRG